MRLLTSRVKVALMISLALASYAPRAAAQEPGTTATATTAWAICGTELGTGPVVVLSSCAFAAGACVGYGLFKCLEWTFPETFVGPPGIPPPPPPPITKELCIFKHSICIDDAEEAWEMAYDMCLALHMDEFSDAFDDCMQGHDKDLTDQTQKCEDEFADCLKNVP